VSPDVAIAIVLPGPVEILPVHSSALDPFLEIETVKPNATLEHFPCV
jgi:hypothetical protein